MESNELAPEIITGILKTILLFLEGQNLRKTCETFLWETEHLGYTTIRSAVAQVLILKPAVTEIVTVTRAAPESDFMCHCQSDSDENGESSDTKEGQSQNKSGPIESENHRKGETNVGHADDMSVDLDCEHMDIMGSATLNKSDSNRTVDGESIHGYIIDSSCFPCENCFQITPISSRSIPTSNEECQELGVPLDERKRSVMFSDPSTNGNVSDDNNQDPDEHHENLKGEISEEPSDQATDQQISDRQISDQQISDRNNQQINDEICDQQINKKISDQIFDKSSCQGISDKSIAQLSDKSSRPISDKSNGQLISDKSSGKLTTDKSLTSQPTLKSLTNQQNVKSLTNQQTVKSLTTQPIVKSRTYHDPISNKSLNSQSGHKPSIKIKDKVNDEEEIQDLINREIQNEYDEQLNYDIDNVDYGTQSDIDYKSISELIDTQRNESSSEDVDLGGASKASLLQSENIKCKNVQTVDEKNEIATMAREWINGLQFDVSVGPPNAGEIKGKEVDYHRLKCELNAQSDEVKLLLLQAIRWKITKSLPEDRDKSIIGLTRCDLLGLHGNACGNPKNSILKSYLLTDNRPLQEAIARLLNAIASSTLGRDYLCQDDRTLRFTIIPLISGKRQITISDTAKEHLLATLQKLSLRSKMRIVMIESGLPEFLVEFLANKHEVLSDYCLEYTCALFMNLCLHRETKFGMRNVSNYLLDMLSLLLNSNQHQHCLPYINGAMYSLFNDPVLREQAKKSSLYEILTKQTNVYDGDIKQQFELIIQVLNDVKLTNPNCIECHEVNEDVEIDHIEPEIDLGDNINGNPNGDELLRNYERKEAFFEGGSLTCLCVPVTPFKKITIKSFCCGLEDKNGLDAVLTTVSEIDQEIAKSNENSKKDQNVTAKVKSKNKSTQSKEKIVHKSEYKSRYDPPPPPIIYEPGIKCPCLNRERVKQENCCATKYDCGCYVQMKKFVDNHCGNCGCPAITRARINGPTYQNHC